MDIWISRIFGYHGYLDIIGYLDIMDIWISLPIHIWNIAGRRFLRTFPSSFTRALSLLAPLLRALSFRFHHAGEGACAVVVVLPSFNHDKSKYDGEAAAEAAVAEVCELVCLSPLQRRVSWILWVNTVFVSLPPRVCLTFFESRTREP